MKRRCLNPNEPAFKDYWWRWIYMCDRRKDSFENFRDDMLPTYQEWLQLDRIDNNWNYCKENCRWATRIENTNNTRRSRTITYKWETLSIRWWSDKLWISLEVIRSRLYNWHKIEYILSKKCRSCKRILLKWMTPTQASKKLNISLSAIYSRIRRKESIERILRK